MCGGTYHFNTEEYGDYGLSPRVRGNRWRVPGVQFPQRTIPACAGEPDYAGVIQNSERDYPRVCGGTYIMPILGRRPVGLSPRVRGNLITLVSYKTPKGTIPACAGEPESCGAGLRIGKDYPRVCGGTITDTINAAMDMGLSPRVRGNRESRKY